MKTTSRLALFLALATSAFAAEVAKTAYTTPVGYTTVGGFQVGYSAASGFFSESLHPGMNVIGLSLHHSTIVSGTIASLGKDFAELTGLPVDAKGNYKLALVQGTTYILEITSGQKAGVIQEITRWQDLRLTLSDDIATAGVKPGDHFTLRKAATLNSVFDPRFTTLLKGENPDTADNILIPQGSSFGDFRRCFILTLPEGNFWMDAATYQPVGDLPLVYPDGLIVQCKGTTGVPMTFSGEVKSGPTRSVIKPGLNLVASPFPIGSSLQDLGLGNDLLKNDDLMQADKVWIPSGILGGLFTTYYLTPENQWICASDGSLVTEKIPVGSAFLIERQGPQALFTLGDGK